MQVSSKLFNQQQMSQFSEINSDIQNLQSKISSGKNILAASDNPIGSVELSGMKTVKGQLDQFIKNTDNSKSRLLSVDANLENLTAIMIRANELMIQGSSDVLGPSDRQAIAIEINEMKKEALGIANQQDSSGAYFFSGYKTKIKPFTEDINGLVKYNGDRGVSSLAISESMMVETTLDGGSVFGNVKNNTGKAISIFSMLENMSYSLGTAAQAVEAAEAPTNAEIQLTNNNLGTGRCSNILGVRKWHFNSRGHPRRRKRWRGDYFQH